VVFSGFRLRSLSEPDEKLGLADFVFSSLMRGTARHTMQQIYDSLESVGASFGYDSGTYMSSFGGRSLAEDLPLLFKVFSETIRYPSFPADQVERLRAQALTGLGIRAQDTADMADLVFDQLLFEGHPYSRPDDGWPETIRSITRRDLVKFHQQNIGPRGLAMAIAGAVEAERAVEIVQRALGGWKNPAQVETMAIPDQAPLKKMKRRFYEIPGKTQSDLVIGTLAPKRKDGDYLAASLGNSILGQFGLMGRIGSVVRENPGWLLCISSLSSGIVGIMVVTEVSTL